MAVQTIKEFANNPAGRVLVVWGPPGVGKTSACRLACHNTAFVHDLRTVGTPLIPRLNRLSSSKRHYAKEIVLLDPLEEVVQSTSDAQKVCKAVAKAGKNSKLGFVLVLNDLYHKCMYPVRAHKDLNATVVRFYRLRANDIKLILMNSRMKKKSDINNGVRVADGDGRKAQLFVTMTLLDSKAASATGVVVRRGSKTHKTQKGQKGQKGQTEHKLASKSADRMLNRFEGCFAIVSKKPTAARSADPHKLLNLWNANIPHIALGPNNVDPTETVRAKFMAHKPIGAALRKKMKKACKDIQTYSEAMENASFADVASSAFRTHDYALESTIAFAKAHSLHPLPRGGCEFPLPPCSHEQHEIKKKAIVLGTTPQELHSHVRTLIGSINEPTAEARSVRTARVMRLNKLHERYDISPELGMHPLETSYRKRFAKKIHQ